MARAVIPGLAHHVTQRGTNQAQVFFNDKDRSVYLKLLKECSSVHRLSILGYCLMTNHVHLVVVPERSDSMRRALGSAHGRYAAYINSVLCRRGHFWQNRFFSCALEESHLWAALRYVERNPVRAGLVGQAADWPWSSARAHALGVADPVLDETPWSKRFAPEEWSVMLASGTITEAEIQLRERTYTGRPLGSPEFVARAERELGRMLRAQPGGRPRRQKAEPDQLVLAGD